MDLWDQLHHLISVIECIPDIGLPKVADKGIEVDKPSGENHGKEK
jgi:hypothetical protein